MKNLISYEDFLNEQSKSTGYDGSVLTTGSSVITFDGLSGVVISRDRDGKVSFESENGEIHIRESSNLIEFDVMNEDLTWWEVTKGILAADAIKVGLQFAGGGVLLAGVLFLKWRNSIANKIEKIKKDERYAELKSHATKIADKFNNDSDLGRMLNNLAKYPYQDTSFIRGKREKSKADESNNTRKTLMRDIAKYVKSKLSPDEKKFFTEINSILRDRPLINDEGKKLEEEVRMVGTGTYTPTTSDSSPMTPGKHNTEDPSSGDSIFFR